MYFTLIFIHEFANKLGSILPPSIYCYSKFCGCRMEQNTTVRDFISGKVMLCSLPQYSLMAKKKGEGRWGQKEIWRKGKYLVSMLFTAPLHLKTFQALIYGHFMYPSFPLPSSSKLFEFWSHSSTGARQSMLLLANTQSAFVRRIFSWISHCLIYPASRCSIFHKTNSCLIIMRARDH